MKSKAAAQWRCDDISGTLQPMLQVFVATAQLGRVTGSALEH